MGYSRTLRVAETPAFPLVGMTMDPASSRRRPFKRYRAYGLKFDSEVELPWPVATAASGRPDVLIRLGEVPPTLESPADGRGCWQTAPDTFLIGMDGVGRCLVSEGGRQIRLALAREGGDALACLTDSILAACLQMRGVLTLHASAIATAEGAVLIAGNVAAGKSTLAAALVDRGYPLLADGIVGVVLGDGGAPLALAGFPSVKLWAGAMKKLDRSWRRAAGAPVRFGVVRYPVPARRFHGDALAVRAVYVLSNSGEGEIDVKTPAPVRAFSALVGCTFRLGFLKGLGQEAVHFRTLSSLVRCAPANYLKRPAAACEPAELAVRMSEHLSHKPNTPALARPNA